MQPVGCLSFVHVQEFKSTVSEVSFVHSTRFLSSKHYALVYEPSATLGHPQPGGTLKLVQTPARHSFVKSYPPGHAQAFLAGYSYYPHLGMQL